MLIGLAMYAMHEHDGQIQTDGKPMAKAW